MGLYTPEQMGEAILEEISYINHQPTHAVDTLSVYIGLYDRKFHHKDIDLGVKYLVKRGYMDKKGFLTEAGLAAIPGDDI